MITLFLAAEYWPLVQCSNWFRALQNSNSDLFGSAAWHWFWMGCLSLYLTWFIYLQRRVSERQGFSIGGLLLPLFAGWAVLHYVLNCGYRSITSDCAVLLATITLAQGLRVLRMRFEKDGFPFFTAGILCCLIFLLLPARFFPISTAVPFGYRGQIRWNGPWNTPNTFGLLMGTAAVLSAGLFLVFWMKNKTADARTPAKRSILWQHAAKVLFLLTLIFASVCLVKSYSRGAWLGTALAFGYLGYSWRKFRGAEVLSLSSKDSKQGTTFGMETREVPGGDDPAEVFPTEWNGATRAISQVLVVQTPAVHRTYAGSSLTTNNNTSMAVHDVVERTTTSANPAFIFFQYVNFLSRNRAGAPKSDITSGVLTQIEKPWLRWLRQNILSISIITVGLMAIACWSLKEIEHPLVQRIVSATNKNDFSWRNRVVAYHGALRIIADKPLLGRGWSRPPAIFESLYKPSHLEAAAILLNDYLSLAMTLGLPALLCFIAYAGLSFGSIKKRKTEDKSGARLQNDWLKYTCRAGAIVLLTGFWFDRGLFDLPTSMPFWVLLELGRE